MAQVAGISERLNLLLEQYGLPERGRAGEVAAIISVSYPSAHRLLTKDEAVSDENLQTLIAQVSGLRGNALLRKFCEIRYGLVGDSDALMADAYVVLLEALLYYGALPKSIASVEVLTNLAKTIASRAATEGYEVRDTPLNSLEMVIKGIFLGGK